jgi:GxxExxY protein
MNIENDLFEEDTQYISINNHINNNDIINNPLINIILNSSINIFKQLGLGFIEGLYHKALLIDLYKTNYEIETKKILPIYYNTVNIGYVEPDIIIQNDDDYIIIELKAFEKTIGRKEELQIKKYINHTNINKNIIGLIINFNQNINNIDKREIEYKII